MYIVTGGAGFIGSNLIEALNTRGESDIFVVDHLADGRKVRNLADLSIADYWDRDSLLPALESGSLGRVDAVFHLGATTATTNWDGRWLMRNNYEFSKRLLHWCLDQRVPLIHASSAAVYGAGSCFREAADCERPVNAYAYSKLLFDQYVRRLRNTGVGLAAPVAGLRFFNVYGPREWHKDDMASGVLRFHRQIVETREAQVFGAHGPHGPGEQRRDFVTVADCVKVCLWCLDHTADGLFNVGTGTSATFNELASTVIDWHARQGRRGEIRFIPFPDELKTGYQSYTQADLTALRAAGYREAFQDITQGVPAYLDWLSSQD